MKRRLLLGVTGASGMPYALRLFEALCRVEGMEVHVLLSNAALEILPLECEVSSEIFTSRAAAVYSERDLGAPPASGSWIHEGMVLCPCSMATLGAVAQGLGHNLIHRAADVTLKEGRRLILVVRETPLHAIHLQNMLSAARAGAVIMPASPGFYHRPTQLQDIVDHIVGRILDRLGVANSLAPRWGEPGEHGRPS
jgi:4-hydroxy-3-polyprenylbenzoate decarboxylase